MNRISAISKSGILFGLAFGFAFTLTGGVGTFWLSHDMEKENLAYIQQSIGDTTQILAAHFRSQFEPLIAHILEAGGAQLHPRLMSTSAESNPLSNIQVGTIEVDPFVSDVSLWKRERHSGALTFASEPKRTYLAINSKYPDANTDFTQQLEASEAVEKNLIEEAFHGRLQISLSSLKLGQKPFGILVAPIRENSSDEVVVAHFRLDQFQKAFVGNSMASGALVDDRGNILARPGGSAFGATEKMDQNPLFRTMKISASGSGQIYFIDENKTPFYGGYTRVGLGHLAILTMIPESEASATLIFLKKQIVLFLGLSFILFSIVGYGIYQSGIISIGIKSNALPVSPNQPSKGKEEQGIDICFQSIKSGPVTILYGTLRQTHLILEKCAPADSVELLNDYFTIASSVVREWGGVFDRTSEKSFVGIWGAPAADGSELWRAIRCALLLRTEFYKLNESRKVDGKLPLSFGMGVHSGTGLIARLGPIKYQRYSVIGEVLNCAKALSRLTVSMRVDLLVSQETWGNVNGKFEGELLGEIKLTHESGLSGVVAVSGYRTDEGQLIEVQVPYESVQFAANEAREGISTDVFIPEKKKLRWLVNNGTQIVGPLTEREIAHRLFAQELDFDCECWVDGVGKSETIRTAGIFSGSGDPNATLWMFDGQTIHGPISAGFIKTALGHGAIREQVFICEGSTIQGWKTLGVWDQSGLFSQSHTSEQKEGLSTGLSEPDRSREKKIA